MGLDGVEAGFLAAQLRLRWMLSPKDSWQTPIWRERKRESPPIFWAMAWSMDGPPAPRPVYVRQETTADMEG